MRIGFLDCEMSNLSWKFGQLLCGVTGEYSPSKIINHIKTFELHDYKTERWNDKGLAMDLRDEIETYDIIVTWNGRRFDIPFLNGRLERWGRRLVRPVFKHEDLMYSAQRHMRCMGVTDAKLDTIAKHLKLPIQKTPLIPQQWVMAVGGHRPSYDQILKHCVHDVKVLANAWPRLKHLVKELK